MGVVEILRWIVAVIVGVWTAWLMVLNIGILVFSLAGHRMPSGLPVVTMLGALVALVALPYQLPWWAILALYVLVYLSEMATPVRNSAVALIDQQKPWIRTKLLWELVRFPVFVILGAAAVFGAFKLIER